MNENGEEKEREKKGKKKGKEKKRTKKSERTNRRKERRKGTRLTWVGISSTDSTSQYFGSSSPWIRVTNTLTYSLWDGVGMFTNVMFDISYNKVRTIKSQKMKQKNRSFFCLFSCFKKW